MYMLLWKVFINIIFNLTCQIIKSFIVPIMINELFYMKIAKALYDFDSYFSVKFKLCCSGLKLLS